MPPCVTQRLSNGLTTAVVHRPGTHQVLVCLMVRVGSRHEDPAQVGVSHFLEHLLFRGNEAFPDADALNRAFEEVGSMLGAQTGVETTEFEFLAHPERLDDGLGRLADFIRRPTFADLDKERRILLDELAYDYNDQGSLIHLAALSSRLMWPGHPLGQNVGGLPETIDTLDTGIIQAHYRRHYRPENMVLGLAGNILPEEAFAMAQKHFGDWTPSPPEPAPVPVPAPAPTKTGPHLCLVNDTDNQFHLQLGFAAPGYNAPEEPAMILLTRILDDGPTSRLQRTIREEKALVYHISAALSAYWDAGALEIATSVKASTFAPLLHHLLRELASIRDHGPTADELERARMRHLFEVEFSRDSLSAQIDRHVWPLLYATPRDEETERRLIQEVRLDKVCALAREVLAPENLHLVLVGPLGADVDNTVRKDVEQYSAT